MSDYADFLKSCWTTADEADYQAGRPYRAGIATDRPRGANQPCSRCNWHGCRACRGTGYRAHEKPVRQFGTGGAPYVALDDLLADCSAADIVESMSPAQRAAVLKLLRVRG